MGGLPWQYIWNQQKEIPVVVRRAGKGERLRVRLPYAKTNRQWLQDGRQTSPDWIPGYKWWEIPKSWFNDFVHRSLKQYGKLYIIQPYREQEKCAPACLNAKGHECECSCMGQNHGEMTEVGLKCPRPSHFVGESGISPVV